MLWASYSGHTKRGAALFAHKIYAVANILKFLNDNQTVKNRSGYDMKITNRILVLVVLTSVPSLCSADKLDDALKAFDNGHYATALRLWGSLAKNGNTIAQDNIASMYQEGKGVPQDYAQAAHWFKRA